ncbi:hypothetical protein [Telmatospirillum siberiense]|uniref:Uncharacterized protein n=1 Tax=Telmatospirillum siberiense TaxID=382514 RepID=A0A2N3PSU8_9PROT|nr:hypothetical protein [Telmatospirillum siberiense]PKU23478.1 hypothetical protein CWS72_16640 [Telmatospirillum siberiense]
MPTDSEHFSPPPGTPAPADDAAQQEEALFKVLLQRVQSSGDKQHLQERCEAALRLILNRDEDQAARDELTANIARLVAALPDDVGSGPGRQALAKAVEASLGLLKTAEQKRLTPARVSAPPAQVKPVPATASAAGYERKAPVQAHGGSHPQAHAHATHSHPPPKETPWSLFGMIALLLVILAVGLVIGLRERGDPPTRPLVAQMEGATRGNIPAANIFGGALRVAVQGGRTVVTVEGIPPGECVSSGWDLVRKGLLTVNGVTPPRVSAAKLNDLCHEEDAATLIWSPKEK